MSKCMKMYAFDYHRKTFCGYFHYKNNFYLWFYINIIYMRENTENTQVVIVRLHKTLLSRFDSVIDDLGLNRSEVIRMLMNEYIEKYNK